MNNGTHRAVGRRNIGSGNGDAAPLTQVCNPQSAIRNPQFARQRGLTLVELMITIGILSIMISMTVPIYRSALIGAKEAALREQLRTLRQYIDEYSADKEKAPASLDDLVSGGYLKELPTDPFTGSNSTWTAEMDDGVLYPDQTEPGIADVHSGSAQISLDGTPYSTW